MLKPSWIFLTAQAIRFLDLLCAHRTSPAGLCPCRFFLFAYRTRFTPSVRKSAAFRKNFLVFTTFHLPLAFSAFRFATAYGKSAVQHDKNFGSLNQIHLGWQPAENSQFSMIGWFYMSSRTWFGILPIGYAGFKLVRPWNEFRVTTNFNLLCKIDLA